MPVVDPGEGGGQEFTGQYEPISSQPAVELQGATDVIDVQEVVSRAIPSNVIFTLRFLPEAYVPGIVNTQRSSWAGYFNAVAAIPGVVAVTTYQDVDAGNQLQDVQQMMISSTSGNSTFPLVVSPMGRRIDYLTDDVNAVRANLDAIEQGH